MLLLTSNAMHLVQSDQNTQSLKSLSTCKNKKLRLNNCQSCQIRVPNLNFGAGRPRARVLQLKLNFVSAGEWSTVIQSRTVKVLATIIWRVLAMKYNIGSLTFTFKFYLAGVDTILVDSYINHTQPKIVKDYLTCKLRLITVQWIKLS